MKAALPIGFVAVLVAAASAHADIIPNTGTGGGSTDPDWSVSYTLTAGGSVVTSLANAPLVTSIPSVWQPNDPPNNNWIGVNSAATIPGAPGDGSKRYIYVFSTLIDAPSAEVLSGAIGFDNFFMGAFIDGSLDATTGTFVGGTEFLTPTQLLGPGNEDKSGFCRNGDGFLPSASFPNCTVNFTVSLPAGQSRLNFVIEGDGATDGFILNQEGVSLNVPEPGALALLGLAFAGIGFARLRKLN